MKLLLRAIFSIRQKNIEVKSGALVAAGVTVQDTTQGEIRSLDTQHAQGANLTLSAEKTISSKANI